jgi:hypothetical protein
MAGLVSIWPWIVRRKSERNFEPGKHLALQRTKPKGNAMRFMMIRRSDALTESNPMPGAEMMAAMDKYMKDMEAAGVLRGGEGLKPSSQGARVKFRSGKPTVTDGPFTETKELIAGYLIIDVPSKKEAIEWAKKWPAIDVDTNVELELRPFFEASDFE